MTDTEQAKFDDLGFGVDPSRQWREDNIKELCFEVLPQQAKDEGWPVVFDHCIARVAYDNGCGAKWKDVVDGTPFYEAASDRQLRQAHGVALRMKHCGVEFVRVANEKSLVMRGELDPDECDYYNHHDNAF